MSVPSAPVNIHVRFTRAAAAMLRLLTEQAIMRAIDNTVARLTELAKGSVSPVPIDTGLLRSSLAAAASPRSIIMHWSAISPHGYDYAKVQDVGRPNMVGKFYSEVMRAYAKMWLVEELQKELNTIGTVGP